MEGASKLSEAARRVMTHAVGSKRSSGEVASAAGGVFEKLLASLSPLLGQVGSYAILRRSLNMTTKAFPSYAAVRGADADLLEAVRACWNTQESQAIQEASVALLTRYFELLGSFIGERLTWQLLQEAWPECLALISPGEVR